MTKRQIRAEWNGAPVYDRYAAAPDWPCIRPMLPDLKGGRVLDLGCGTGLYTFLLEAYEPRILIGVDLSEEMLRIAREKAGRSGSAAAFILGDARRAHLLAGTGYDLVFSAGMAQCIRDLTAFMVSVSQCVRPGGWCILAVPHPVRTACAADDGQLRYFDRGMRSFRPPWAGEDVHGWHHTFGEYVGAGLAVGMRLCDVEEPPHDGDASTLPPSLILKFQK